MTELRIEPYVIPSVDLGPENPLPVFRSNQESTQFTISDSIPEEDRHYLGWQTGHRVLPHRLQDGYDRNKRPKSFQSIVLENEYLQVRVLPELGGRVVSIIHKPEGREILECNPVFQPANLALRNAWFSGGIEWNTSHFGHYYLTCSPVFAARIKGIDGEPVLRIYEWDRVKCFPWQVDLHLPSGSQFLFARVRLLNPHDFEIPMYWWTNIAVPELPDGRVIAPASSAITNAQAEFALTDLPHFDGSDISYPVNCRGAKEFFFRIPEGQRRWITMLDSAGSGLVQTSTDRLKGRKFFCWGMSRGGRRWQEYLSVPGKAYIEIQAGLARTQIECVPMPAGAEWTWTEAYGLLSTDPGRTHSNNWDDAVKAVDEALEETLPANTFNSLHEQLACVTTSESEEILAVGAGWGALERKRCVSSGQEDKVPQELLFPEGSMGMNQNQWMSLLETGTLPERDPNRDPGQFMVQSEWRELLEKSVSEGMSDHWLGWYHLGVMRMEAHDTAGAEEAWKTSIERRPTGWALRNLAVIKNLGQNEEASLDLLKQAWVTGPKVPALAVAYAHKLMHLAMYEALREFIATLPEDIQRNERLQIAGATAALRTGHPEELDGFFDREFVSIREGEITLTDLWYEYQEQLISRTEGIPVDKKLRKRVRKELQPPYTVDFRMHATDD